jgi:hypothetical protein
MRPKILYHLHAGHPGIQRMKALARSYVYWPNMDKDVENFVKSCRPCVDTAKAPVKTHLQSWPKETRPWRRIHVDFAGPMNGYYYLVVVDSFSKWPEVLQTRSITTKETISLLRPLFARYGSPEIIVTDNGANFTATDFEAFCASFGVTHLRSPPYHPQSNGQAERFVDTIKRGLQKFKGEEAEKALQEILYTYRYTPGNSVPENKSPAELFLGRKLRNVFDLLKPTTANNEQRLPHRDIRMEQQFNKHHGTRSRQFHIGDTVWTVRRPGTTPEPGVISRRIGHVLYDVLVGGETYRRHANQLSSRPNTENSPRLINRESATDENNPNSRRYPVRTTHTPQRYQ